MSYQDESHQSRRRWGFGLTLLGGGILAWYEKIFSGETVGWILRFCWDGAWWAIRGVFQLLTALVLLVGTGNFTMHWPAYSSAPVLSEEHKIVFRMAAVLAPWKEGDTIPAIETVGDEKWWTFKRGVVETGTHVDGQNRPVERKCIYLYASKAIPSPDPRLTTPSKMKAEEPRYFLTASPYVLGIEYFVAWPEVARSCRIG